jgi:HK97 family phage prohead protease
MSDEQRPQGELHYRTATQLAVNFPQRTIELIVIPYDTDALVDQPYGRPVLESVAPGAFEGIERRANRIRVNRDHERQRTVGRAVRLHPSRDEGLVGEIRIAQTALGDETLQLADEEMLDASASFLPMPGGQEWSRDRRRVRLTKLWLSHIAMTPEPAYESARVLAVRNHTPPVDLEAPAPRPNLETVKGWLLSDVYDLTVR